MNNTNKRFELEKKLQDLGLHTRFYTDGLLAIVKPGIANPLLFVDTSKEYKGNVDVKSINTWLYSQEQVHKALIYVDEFLK